MGVAVPCGKLNDTQWITTEPKPHRFRINSDRSPEAQAFGQVASVDMDCHAAIATMIVTASFEEGWCPGEDSNLHGR